MVLNPGFFEWLLIEAKKSVPKSVFNILSPVYHYLLAFLGALIYGFPSRKLFVIGITGTKGKTTTVEVLNAILEDGGKRTAIASTLRFKVGNMSERNLYKMTMPGRMAIQKIMRRALREKCSHIIIEMTSEGVRQFRHKFISLDALIFTNLSPEHIESHGSYEKYRDAKLEIAKALSLSPKRPRYIVANKDDKEAEIFLSTDVEKKLIFGLSDVTELLLKKDKSSFRWKGAVFSTTLRGEFNIYNILAGTTLAHAIGIDIKTIKRAVSDLKIIRGRMERVLVEDSNGNEFKDFEIIVDYAHTPDSLSKVYDALMARKKICVLGGTGGGRDRWKRSLMGAIAASYCREIILTDEDPYDEDPFQIINDIRIGIEKKSKSIEKEGGKIPILKIIIDRKEAIETAVKDARRADVVIITGKGTDPYIMGPEGTREPWDDASVARDALSKIIA
jgi:UDP-N-acetylmuramoyl-L-alanyl-D-glutamate--2,6-diaminopimelate ligase